MGRSRSTSSQSQTTETKNLNFQDIDGVAVVADGNVTLSDQGAIDAAGLAFNETIDLARDVIAAGVGQNDSVKELAAAVVNSESKNDAPRIESVTKTALLGIAVIAAAAVFKG